MKNEKLEKSEKEQEQNLLIGQARKLAETRVKFRIRRNTTNMSTGEKLPGKIETGWEIANITNEGTITMHRSYGSTELFHINIKELWHLNKDLFESDTTDKVGGLMNRVASKAIVCIRALFYD